MRKREGEASGVTEDKSWTVNIAMKKGYIGKYLAEKGNGTKSNHA